MTRRLILLAVLLALPALAEGACDPAKAGKWHGYVDAIGAVVNGERTVTYSICNPSGAVVGGLSGTVQAKVPLDGTPEGLANRVAAYNAIRHRAWTAKYPVAAPPAPGVGDAIDPDN